VHRLRLPEPAHLRAEQRRGRGGAAGAGRGVPATGTSGEALRPL